MQPEKLIAEIIKEQSLIIGEKLAKSRAEDTGLVSFSSSRIEDVTLGAAEPTQIIQKLVDSYMEIFGKASVEVCVGVMRKHPIVEINNLVPETLKASL
ncbi:MAG: hypothetical protein UU64_C0021G0007 [candidate division WWE3 bacterium GW2011_GWF2_41_45]|uniref:Uncharacterized protein n=3 Tax=Katanobacteria TaxID=422282 RepID=A0A1F4W029_UNCKA|nr:MAG: hypothetical protein UU55_C0005G0092 [candidate division WWE3 bacterium GW2011_GWC2_41_23]KKS08760.1 MAG: hypothetical protein UU64_C0021G0007 [candidate division WWE3 bacterium GW2011_GWF2_41_45]KKS11793.1 MAG: hypothetical protein UU68_C0011G0006 [candidate division WWE3 bacterium GW2011_GWF1_41_53]KKS19409.1 MAG: hypothetical protein UU79_C0020G0006 [candidate division WWE3 bacterium GW2011_GWE1_41_72]KKS30093.1 MAG: hypothetical protein UU90_C0005G0053 [candidate division WWE3 bacte